MATFPIYGQMDKESAAGAVAKTIIADDVGATNLEVMTLIANDLVVGNTAGIGANGSVSANLVVGPSGATWSSLRITTGSAPTSPVNGDIWFDGAALKIRIAGATKTVQVL